VPKALTSDHSTRAGVWGLLTVTAGRVRYRIPAADEVLDIDAGETAVIEPQVPHSVELSEDACFHVAFYE
jgi:tellurite resistance-related uncharacterized protein